MWKYSVLLLLLAVMGCSEVQGTEGNPSSSLQAAYTNGEAPSSSCSDLLVEWASLVPADLKEVEPPSDWDLVQKYEAGNRTWTCLPKGVAGRVDVDKSVVIGLAMLRPDGADSSRSVAITFFEWDSSDELGPCATAWGAADLFAEQAVEEANSYIDDTTWACFSVDEWWLNLKRFPTVFGVSDYPDSDRWSYLAAVCPANNVSEMCVEARTSGALEP